MEVAPEIRYRIAVLIDELDQLPALTEPKSVEWLLCNRIDESVFAFFRGDSMVARVDLESPSLDLQNLVGLIVVGGISTFDAVRSKWESSLPSLKLAIRRASKCDNSSIYHEAMQCIAEELTLQRSHSGRTALQLSAYRKEFDRLQTAFSRLEQYIAKHSLERTAEIFEYPIGLQTTAQESSSEGLGNTNAALGQRLTQYLPVDSIGVSSVSLHLSAVPEPGSEPLRISLMATETEASFGPWSVAPDQVSLGWNEFSLDRAIDEDALTMFIAVECSSVESGWALTLGPPLPYPEFCAQRDGDYLRAPLALRIRTGLPGVRVSRTAGAFYPEKALRGRSEAVSFEALGSAIQALPEIEENGTKLVHPDPDSASITVHPCKDNVTVARLDFEAPSEAWAVSVQIHLAHAEANWTQFAMSLCAPRQVSEELVRLSESDSLLPGSPEWRGLSALESGRLLVPIERSQNRKMAILLATRQAPNASPAFAWARFSALEFHLLPNHFRPDGTLGLLPPSHAAGRSAAPPLDETESAQANEEAIW